MSIRRGDIIPPGVVCYQLVPTTLPPVLKKGESRGIAGTWRGKSTLTYVHVSGKGQTKKKHRPGG